MALVGQSINYVKFIKGTPAAFEKLQTKDSNTLYFISSKEEGTKTGVLYIGDKLVTTGNLESPAITTLNGLADTKITNLKANDILQYNGDTQSWENKPLDISGLTA